MNKTDKMLDDLFAQARRAPASLAESELSKGLENRIMADWRGARGAAETHYFVPLLRWGFGFALTASLAIIASSMMTSQGNELTRPELQVSTYAGMMTP